MPSGSPPAHKKSDRESITDSELESPEAPESGNKKSFHNAYKRMKVAHEKDIAERRHAEVLQRKQAEIEEMKEKYHALKKRVIHAESQVCGPYNV